MLPPIFISNKPHSLLYIFPIDIPQRNTYTGLTFILTTAGKAIVEIDKSPYTLQPGILLTLLPSHLLNTIRYSADFQCLTFAFMFDAMTDFPYMLQSYISEAMERNPSIQLTGEELNKLEDWHKTISRHYQLTTHPSYQEILRSFIFIFTTEVSAIYSSIPIKASATHNEELTDGFFRLLHEHFRTNRETAFYAGRLCISPKHLSKIIRQVTGHVPSYWITDFTVREAKMLLKSTTLTITQLSEKLNFPNSSFFARYFKRYVQMAPQEYRFKSENQFPETQNTTDFNL